jgi:hypothetical protein
MAGQTNWYRHYNEVKNEDALNRYVAQTYRKYGVLEGQLRKSDGESVLEMGHSAVDMHFYPWVLQHDYAQLSIEKYPMIKKLLEIMGSRQEVKAAYEKIPKGEHAWGGTYENECAQPTPYGKPNRIFMQTRASYTCCQQFNYRPSRDCWLHARFDTDEQSKTGNAKIQGSPLDDMMLTMCQPYSR